MPARLRIQSRDRRRRLSASSDLRMVTACFLWPNPVLAYRQHFGGDLAKPAQINNLQMIPAKRVEMKTVTTSILAAAVLWALPYASAEACNNTAWNGNVAAAGSVPAGPAQGQARYGGLCSLRTTAPGQFVTDNTPSAEGLYQARFYVWAQPTGGTATVFRATTGNSNGGTEAFRVDFTGTSFTFPGSGAGAITGVQAGRWYGVEVTNNRSANTFTARVRGAGVDAISTSSGTAAAADVTSASLGFIGGGATGGTVIVDDFESTRSATPIGFLCRGNANNTGSSANTRDIDDVTLIVAEIFNEGFAPGTPDFNEDGAVTIDDVGGVVDVIFSPNPGC